MQKWEYLFVTCDLGRPRHVNGNELPDWKKNRVAAWANQRGDEGWELVSEAHMIGTVNDFLSFKRPKA